MICVFWPIRTYLFLSGTRFGKRSNRGPDFVFGHFEREEMLEYRWFWYVEKALNVTEIHVKFQVSSININVQNGRTKRCESENLASQNQRTSIERASVGSSYNNCNLQLAERNRGGGRPRGGGCGAGAAAQLPLQHILAIFRRIDFGSELSQYATGAVKL